MLDTPKASPSCRATSITFVFGLIAGICSAKSSAILWAVTANSCEMAPLSRCSLRIRCWRSVAVPASTASSASTSSPNVSSGSRSAATIVRTGCSVGLGGLQVAGIVERAPLLWVESAAPRGRDGRPPARHPPNTRRRAGRGRGSVPRERRSKRRTRPVGVLRSRALAPVPVDQPWTNGVVHGAVVSGP